MDLFTVREYNWSGRRALVRVDFNVPLDPHGGITDDSRIRASLPTLNHILGGGATVTLMSHLGRPRGEADRPRLSLAPVAIRLSQLLGRPVELISDLARSPTAHAVSLLENTRFHAGETANDPGLASQFSLWGDLFVNDAFATLHRAHASTVGVAAILPSVAGFLVEEEISALGSLASSPEMPMVALLGGAKISDKIEVIRNLLQKVDAFLLGGGMANTFLQAQGYDMGASLVEHDALPIARELLKESGDRIHLPSDLHVAAAPETAARRRYVPVDEVPADWMAVDIGIATVAHFANRLSGAATVFWNGPMGLAEVPPFDQGSGLLAQRISELPETKTVVGGGDSAALVQAAGFADRFSHVSTGGGATLEFVGGKELPGLLPLKRR